MSKFLSLVVFFVLVCCPSLYGHGGTYRGPGDTVPPGGGGGGGSGGPNSPGPTPPPNGPNSPGPNSPSPASPGAPAGQPGGGPSKPTSPAGLGGPDLTQWSFWWEFNKDPYLALKNKIHKGGPRTGGDDFFLGHGEKDQSSDIIGVSPLIIRDKIIPALLDSLETQNNNDIITGCLMSLAKIGNQTVQDSFVPVIIPFLKDSNQEISETAALALGILGSEESIPLLTALVLDTREGRVAVGRTNEVPFRTRTFAVYALGLVASESDNPAVVASISTELRGIIVEDKSSYKDVKIAAVVSLGLLNLDTEARVEQVRFLLDYFKNERNNHLVRAHIPEALSFSIANANEEEYALYKEVICNEFLSRLTYTSSEKREVQQSCVIGLGLLGDADNDEIDKKIRKALFKIPVNVSDQQTRSFTLIALATLGSKQGTGPDGLAGTGEVQKYLITQVQKGKSFAKPWAYISLGVLSNRLREAQLPVPDIISKVLLDGVESEKSPNRVGAACIATGLAGVFDVEGLLLKKLSKTSDGPTKGYICVGLGLLNEREAIEPIKEIIGKSKFRPALLQQAAISLGLMGDFSLVPDLVMMLKESRSTATQASIVMSLAFIGDSRSVDPLVELLNDDTHTERARGFAAVALGMVADRMLLPWNSSLSCDLNYRASTPTLNALEGTGILNIL
tara:strand:+ start:4274 stop:6304 length:2031 start_codon:yes stop_codon:yes gene_type:complete